MSGLINKLHRTDSQSYQPPEPDQVCHTGSGVSWYIDSDVAETGQPNMKLVIVPRENSSISISIEEDYDEERCMAFYRRELFALLGQGSQEKIEDGFESQFEREFKQLFETNPTYTMEALHFAIHDAQFSTDVIRATLKVIGWCTVEDRIADLQRKLFEDALRSSSYDIREGALIGLSSLNDPQTLRIIQRSASNEKNSFLRQIYDTIIKQLQDTDHAEGTPRN